MEKNINKVKDKKILVISILVIMVVFAVMLVLLTREEPEPIEERTFEEILIDEQTEELREAMEDFEILTDEDIVRQTDELDNLFERMTR